MNRNEEIAASVRRLSKLKLESTDREASTAVAKSAAAGRLASSMHVQLVEMVCLSGFRQLSTASAVLIAEIEGEGAPEHADRLGEVLGRERFRMLAIFDERAAPGQSGGVVKGFARQRRQSLEQAITEAIEGTVADLKLGIAGGVNVRKQKAGVSIDNRGGAGQFVIDSPGASQNIGGDQTSTAGIDVAAFADLLRQVRDEVAKAAISTDAQESIGDAIINAERELQTPSPNPGRVKRLLIAVATVARDFGVNVGAALVTAKLQQIGVQIP